MGINLRRTTMGFQLPPSPFAAEHRRVEVKLIGPGPAANFHPNRTFSRPDMRLALTDEELADVVLSPDRAPTVAKRYGIATATVYRYRRMYDETGRVYDREILP